MTSPETPDDYEREHMAGAESLARSKVRIPWYVSLWFLVPWLLVAGSSARLAVAAGNPALLIPAAGVGLLIALLLVLHSHLRLTVTARAVHVQLGIFGPTIPLERVVSCEVDRHEMPDWLAWGIKWTGPRQWAYFAPGAAGRGVALRYLDEGGTERGLFVSCHDPETIAQTVKRAKAAPRGVRIAPDAVASAGEADVRDEDTAQPPTRKAAR